MDDVKLAAIVEAVVKELLAAGAISAPATSPAPVAQQPVAASAIPTSGPALTIDLPDPTTPAARYAPGVKQPSDPDGLRALIAATTARIGVGRAGPRYTTASLLRFQADHAITQDALYRDVDPKLLSELGLFGVETRITGGKQEYLLRPDLGRQLADEAKRTIRERCTKNPSVQLVVGDGLSSLCRTPVPALIRWISPGRIVEPLPSESWCASSPARTYEMISMSRWPWVPNPMLGATRSSLMTRRARKPMWRGSW